MSHLMPRQAVPSLAVDTLSGVRWDLAESRAERFDLVVFYRGLHCPICRGYIGELDRLVEDFSRRGVSVMALSSDTEDRARRTHDEWRLQNLDLGYGLDLDEAREWGLFVSTSRGMTSIGVEEPALFSEPGVFLVRTDGTLYWSIVQTMPFSRPHFKEMLAAIDFVIENDYPARGEA